MDSGANIQRLFSELRLHPWIPDHQKTIEIILAGLAIEDPSRHDHFKAAYETKLEQYQSTQTETVATVSDFIPEEIVEEIPTVEAVEEVVEVAPVIEEPIVEEENVLEEALPELETDEAVVVKPKKGKKSKSSPSL